MKKKFTLLSAMFMMLFLTGCSVSADYISVETASGPWERFIVLPLSQLITLLYNFLGGNLGFAIIIATLIFRLALLPLMNYSNKSMMRMQEMQPKIQQIQKKYEGKKDQASQIKMQQEFKELGYNPLAGCLPMLIQMPLFMAFFQAISRHPLIVSVDSSSFFFGMDLSATMSLPNYIFGILIAGLTYFSQRLMMKRNAAATSTNANQNPAANNAAMKVMNIYMPFLMFTMVISMPVAMGLYFLTGNIVQLIQTLVLKRPSGGVAF